MQPKIFLKILTIIHTTLTAGLLIFAIFAYYQNQDFIARMDRQSLFTYIVPIVAAAGYFLSQWIFKKQLEAITEQEQLSLKLGKYQTASILKYAVLEGPGLLALLAYLWTGNALHLVIALALIVYLFVQRPNAEKIKRELPLNLEEQKQFDELI
ncbi:hypothetical protein RQM65_18780 [Pricia sp. S334]|uniref:MFS transporter n=1 Tax=Pricia mediterranea TaxID=3076079 RepID=A0ABU3LAL6_9FLAO|nr:hypothetical protein [Pricia sp. S334]MDT7830722.1 hypothetical protein [Pricia sp. S334]